MVVVFGFADYTMKKNLKTKIYCYFYSKTQTSTTKKRKAVLVLEDKEQEAEEELSESRGEFESVFVEKHLGVCTTAAKISLNFVVFFATRTFRRVWYPLNGIKDHYESSEEGKK